ncbi:hypothetical protein I4U23_020401 [Adineta vaga]|nr:hypothetical protein I4U23_020401 [Adineta vaga]
MNTLKNIQKSFFCVVSVSIIIYSQIFYCYDANLILTPLKCYGKSTVCRLFSDFVYGSFSILLPLVCMIIFGIKTIFNIHHVQTRIRPNNVTPLHHSQNLSIIYREITVNLWKKQDRHLFIMLTVQVIIQSILTLPQVMAKIYISTTMFQLQTPLKLSMDHFIYNFALLLSFLANGMPFYIYTLCGGTVFRKPLSNLSNLIITMLVRHR